MAPSYLRVMRLVCRSWAEFGGRHLSSLKPERLDGPRLAQRFPHLRSLDLSHCQRMIVRPKVCVLAHGSDGQPATRAHATRRLQSRAEAAQSRSI